jgi:FAD/FMN-containing dehydrogenase
MKSTILVITGEPNWTRRAVHLAAAMAHEAGAALTIVRMVPVAHLEYLGAGEREELLPYDEFDALSDYVATAEAYGVAVTVELFEYADYTGGLLSAAEQVAALAVFAPAPGGAVALLARWRLWLLRRRMGCPFYALNPGDKPPAWTEATPDQSAAAAAAPRVSAR